MKSSMECISCFARQIVSAADSATSDPALREEMVRRGLKLLSDISFDQPPPVLAMYIHRMIRELTGNPDPYLSAKRDFNELTLSMLPKLRQTVRASADPFDTAMRIAIAGNIIDFGVGSHESIEINSTLEDTLGAALGIDDSAAMRADISNADSILYLADNTGEIAFDRLFIEEALPLEKVTVVVKGGAVLNDATRDDAEAVGLTKLVNVIDNGIDLPGNYLDMSPREFRDTFNSASVVISKGQGNYETLSEYSHPSIYFLLKVKCNSVADHLACSLMDTVVKKGA
ncbi:MAG: DUF89 family protein [Planctomycetes bacterium]|nr:DUF89 family protein [Planctomycetota bacterium]